MKRYKMSCMATHFICPLPISCFMTAHTVCGEVNIFMHDRLRSAAIVLDSSIGHHPRASRPDGLINVIEVVSNSATYNHIDCAGPPPPARFPLVRPADNAPTPQVMTSQMMFPQATNGLLPTQLTSGVDVKVSLKHFENF